MPRNDQRRRRVVMDEALNLQDRALMPGSESAEVQDAHGQRREDARPGRGYDARAERRHQAKTTDLFPKRLTSLLGFAAALVTVVGLLNLLKWLASERLPAFPESALAGLQLSTAGSLASWFSTALFMGSCLASLQIYALRQHRQNDYLGTYRIWLLIAALCLLGSLNCVVDLEGLLSAFWTAGGLAGSSWIWLIATLKLVALCAIFVRGLIEVRSSRGTLAIVSIAWLVYLSCWFLKLPVAERAFVREFDLVYGNSLLVAHLCLTMALVVYCRFVFLEANGLIAVQNVATVTETDSSAATGPKKSRVWRRAKAKRNTPAETAELATTATRLEHESKRGETTPSQTSLEDDAAPEKTPSRASGPLASRLKQLGASKASERAETVESTDELNSPRPLSKAEKKKLKKAQQRESLRRAA